VALIATRDPVRIRSLFSSIASWSQQAQAGFVLRDGPLPMLSRSVVERVVTARDAVLTDLNVPQEGRMLVLPAVDGDYIEVATSDERLFESLRATTVAACLRRDLLCESRHHL